MIVRCLLFTEEKFKNDFNGHNCLKMWK